MLLQIQRCLEMTSAQKIQVYVSNATFAFKTLQYLRAFYIEIQSFFET